MPYKKQKKKCTQSDGDKGNYVLSYTTKKGEKRSACHTSEKNMQGQIAAIEAEADMSEEEVIEEIRALVREEVIRLGRASADVGPIAQDMDLMAVAVNMLDAEDSEGLEELVDLNNAVYTSIDRRDAWEAIGEQMLEAWGYDAPAQGKKAAAAAGDSDGGSVATFWDVRKDGILYSVKTSFKNPTGPANYKQATQSSNIKLTALFSAVKENSPDTMLGNIGCIYSEEENSRTVGWGDVTAPISAGDLKDKIRDIIEKNIGERFDGDALDLYDQLTGAATGKKMTTAEAKSAKKIVDELQNAGLVSSGARLTGKVTEFLGPYVNTPLASLKVYEPSYFFSETLAKLSGSGPKGEAAPEDARNNAVKRITTLTRGMSSAQLDKLLNVARDLMRESLLREYVIETLTSSPSSGQLLKEELTGSDKSEIKRMIKKEIEGVANRKEIDRAFKKNFDKELRKALGASFFGTPGKINKFVIDEIQKEVEKNMGSSANREVVVRICKDVLVKLYRELSFSYKPVIDRMKV